MTDKGLCGENFCLMSLRVKERMTNVGADFIVFLQERFYFALFGFRPLTYSLGAG